jgi:hypothetical protein
MYVDLSDWEGLYVSNESRLVSMFSDDYVVSIMFFDLCLVDGVCWHVS